MSDKGTLRGHRVKALREKRGMTQEELGARIGVEGRQIIRYEKPDANPDSRVVAALATALNTSSDYLLGLTGDDDPRLVFAELSAEERALIVALRNRQPSEAIEAFAALAKGGE